MKVSWQVSGIRKDAWAVADRTAIEEEKPAEERGYYLHPALYGEPEERGIVWARYGEHMQKIEEQQGRIEELRRQMGEERRQRTEEMRRRMEEGQEGEEPPEATT